MKLRARHEEDKAARVATILKAGREILSRRPPGEFTMAGVAERAGIVKGTIYLYFPTKEDLLAAMNERIFSDYLDRVDTALQKRARWTLAKIAALLADHVPPRESSIRLVPHDRLAATAELIDARVPGLRRGDGMRFLLCTIAMLTGLRYMNVHREFRYGVTALAEGMEKRR